MRNFSLKDFLIVAAVLLLSGCSMPVTGELKVPIVVPPLALPAKARSVPLRVCVLIRDTEMPPASAYGGNYRGPFDINVPVETETLDLARQKLSKTISEQLTQYLVAADMFEKVVRSTSLDGVDFIIDIRMVKWELSAQEDLKVNIFMPSKANYVEHWNANIESTVTVTKVDGTPMDTFNVQFQGFQFSQQANYNSNDSKARLMVQQEFDRKAEESCKQACEAFFSEVLEKLRAHEEVFSAVPAEN